MIFLNKKRRIKEMIRKRMEDNMYHYRAYITKFSDLDSTDDEKRASRKLSEIHLERWKELYALYQEIK